MPLGSLRRSSHWVSGSNIKLISTEKNSGINIVRPSCINRMISVTDIKIQVSLK